MLFVDQIKRFHTRNTFLARTALVFFLKDELWRHRSGCSVEGEIERSLVTSCKLLLFSSVNENHSDILTQVVHSERGGMRNFAVTLVIKNDSLILTYGSFVLDKKGAKDKNYISEKMRNLARLVMQLRIDLKQPEWFLFHFIKPEHFHIVMKSTKIVCVYGLNEDEEVTSAIPSLALKLEHALKKCASLKHGLGLTARCKKDVTDAKEFGKLFGIYWGNSISSSALKCLGDSKFTKIVQLPLTEDLLKLRNYIKDNMTLLILKLDAESHLDYWRELAELTVSRILIFNKRRSNEAAKLSVRQFHERPDWDSAQVQEVTNALKPIEKVLCRR